MRIVQVMLGKGFGGAERSFVDLCGALSKRDHDVLAICERRADALKQIMQIPAVASVSLRILGPWDVFARREIRRALKDFRADIVQVHLARAATLAGPAAHALGIPSLAKTHNYVDLKYYRLIDHLVPTTKKQERYLLSAGIPSSRISRIPNFSAIEPRQKPLHERDRKPIVAVGIGRFVHKKGFDTLLRAISIVRGKGLEIELALAGGGPEERVLHALCEELGLRDVVNFLGWRDDVSALLGQADVFVLPSRDEPFGIVCLEAMACDVPIIATTTDGPAEFLDAHSALLVPPDEPAALAGALMEVGAHPEAARQRAAVARDLFARHYSEQAVVQRYLELYEQLLALDELQHP